ncbi:MAG: glycosyltransferase family 39 protein [Bryobacteraceae bacterium]|nr:glycosyltransferase family 39 protein [Bryobacteraceae bacterium]
MVSGKRLGLLAVAGVAGLLAVWSLPRIEGTEESYAPVVAVWGTSWLLYCWVAAGMDGPRWRPAWGWREPVFLAALAAGAFGLRFWQLDSLPFTLGGDEAAQGLEVVRVLKGELRNPFGTGWLGVPTMSFFYNAWSVGWLGANAGGLRLAWVVVGTLSVVTTYLLARRLSGPVTGWTAAFLVAVYHYHIHYSRLGSNQIADTLFTSTSLWLLIRGVQTGSRGSFALAGCCAGLGLYGYAGARLTAVLLLSVTVFLLLRSRGRVRARVAGGGLWMLGGFVLAAGPMIEYAVRRPDDFNARLNQIGILQNGWLTREVELTGRSAVELLFEQLQRAALAFHVYPDQVVWYGLPEPLLDRVSGVLFVLGLAVAGTNLFRGSVRARRAAPMLMWWLLGTVLGGALTVSPPSSQRLIGLSVPVCFFVALALGGVMKQACRQVRGIRPGVGIVAGCALFAAVSLHTYFSEYTPRRIYGGRHAELATMLAPEYRRVARTHRVLFAGPPEMYWEFATNRYLAPEAEGEDLLGPVTLETAPVVLKPGRGAYFVILPSRMGELEALRHWFPGGVERMVHSAGSGALLGAVYRTEP